jgi:flagellum-specific peptidoglycan hydrolase FlgJ
MKEIIALIQSKFLFWFNQQKGNFIQFLQKNKWQLSFLLALLYFANQQKFNFTMPETTFDGYASPHKSKGEKASFVDMSDVIAFIKGNKKEKTVEKNLAKSVAQKQKSWKDDNASNDYSNVSFWGGRNDANDKRTKKRAIQESYIKRFVKIAQAETEKFGVPTSIILAQGILESNAGGSRLAVNNNNHFGIKCFSRACAKGHCTNFTDDSHKDFFKKYESPWQSFRDHSVLLKRFHYRKLFRLNRKDYRAWAEGLQRMGYATDKHYAESLIRTVEDLGLNRWD